MKHTAADRPLWLRAFHSVRHFPVDLVATLVLIALADLTVVLPSVRGTTIRTALVLPALLVVPGYALVSVLFPGTRQPTVTDPLLNWLREDGPSAESRVDGVDMVERLALAFGMSVALLPILAVTLSLTTWGITAASTLTTVSLLAVAGALVGAIRRNRLPAEERFVVPYRGWIVASRNALTGRSVADSVIAVALAVAVLLAAGSFAYAVATPRPAESYSTLSLLAENDAGELVASGYPTQFVRGEGEELAVSITNHEGHPTRYTVVVLLQRVETNGGSATVVEQERLGRMRATIAPGETWTRRHTVSPAMTGGDLRLKYLLYAGDPPADPNAANADEHAHIWISVAESAPDRPEG